MRLCLLWRSCLKPHLSFYWKGCWHIRAEVLPSLLSQVIQLVLELLPVELFQPPRSVPILFLMVRTQAIQDPLTSFPIFDHFTITFQLRLAPKIDQFFFKAGGPRHHDQRKVQTTKGTRENRKLADSSKHLKANKKINSIPDQKQANGNGSKNYKVKIINKSKGKAHGGRGRLGPPGMSRGPKNGDPPPTAGCAESGKRHIQPAFRELKVRERQIGRFPPLSMDTAKRRERFGQKSGNFTRCDRTLLLNDLMSRASRLKIATLMQWVLSENARESVMTFTNASGFLFLAWSLVTTL